MPRDRTSRLLDEFAAVTDAAPRPDTRRIQMGSRFPVATLSAASVIVVVVAVAAIVLGRQGPAITVGVGGSPAPSAVQSAQSVPASTVPASTVPATPVPASAVPATPVPATPVPSVRPTAGPCRVAHLSARIVLWEGAAGQRIADVELTNRGTTECLLYVLDRPQLVGGDGKVLIDGANPTSGGRLRLAPGAIVKTMVAAGNYCKATPQPPVSVAFVFADGQRLVADPFAPDDMTLPPCNGAGAPATITMHPWAK